MHYPAELASLMAREADNATAAPVMQHGNEVFDITSPMQQGGFALILIFPILAFVAVCLRVYGRLSVKQLWIDDILVVIAMVRQSA